MSNVLKENYKKLVDALAPYFGGTSDFDDLTNRPLESDAIDIDDLDLPMPSKPTDYPIMFDETGTEYKAGYYKRASDGKVKPIYRKDIVSTYSTTTAMYTVPSTYNVIKHIGSIRWNDGASQLSLNVTFSNSDYVILRLHNREIIGDCPIPGSYNMECFINIWFTKTTDEWKEV